MSHEQNGQGAVDEKVPPTKPDGWRGCRAFDSQPRDVKEQDQNVTLHTESSSFTPASASDSNPKTTLDIEKAFSDVNAVDEEQLAPRNVVAVDSPKAGFKEDGDPDSSPPEVEHSYPEGGLDAWLVVFGSFTGMTACFGVMNTVGTYEAYLSTHQLATSSPSLVGWIFSLYIFLAFFCGVQIGPIFDAKGPRWLVLAGSACLVGGTFAFAESSSMCTFIHSIFMKWLLTSKRNYFCADHEPSV